MAGDYELTFDLSSFSSNFNGNGALVIVNVKTGGGSVLGGGAVAFTRPEPSGYATKHLTFTAPTDGIYSIGFSQPGGHGTNLDNVQLNTGTPSGTPEPSSLVLLSCGALGVIAYLRRRSG